MPNLVSNLNLKLGITAAATILMSMASPCASFSPSSSPSSLLASLARTGHSYSSSDTVTTSAVARSSSSISLGITKKDGKNDFENGKYDDLINDFCIGTNDFWKQLVISPVRNYVEIQPSGTAKSDIFSKLKAAPEIPGISRPVWLTILGSVPTGLGWYGYYKFSVEEELYQYELQNGEKVSGCGGYGTLFPFVYGVIIGFPLQFLHIPGGETIVSAAALWILLGQVNLYRRVNELCEEPEIKKALGLEEPPLYTWWALLPPPLDVVVGLRQVHHLSEAWRIKRGDEYDKDIIAEDLFPFISSQRFTLKEFVTEPSRWFWFTKKWDDFDIKKLQDK